MGRGGWYRYIITKYITMSTVHCYPSAHGTKYYKTAISISWLRSALLACPAVSQQDKKWKCVQSLGKSWSHFVLYFFAIFFSLLCLWCEERLCARYKRRARDLISIWWARNYLLQDIDNFHINKTVINVPNSNLNDSCEPVTSKSATYLTNQQQQCPRSAVKVRIINSTHSMFSYLDSVM